jgi:hypothetical protein
MSVPTHNLYDFVHQTTKKQYSIMYYQRWGSRDLMDVYPYQTSDVGLNGSQGIALKDRYTIPKLPIDLVNHAWAIISQPTLFCHDQEPLNFDLYSENGSYVNDFYTLFEQHRKISVNPALKNTNLRLTIPNSLQKTWTLLHSEINSKNLDYYESTGQFIGAYWWSHAAISRDWYRYAQYDKALNPASDVSKLFLIYCRAFTGSREYRVEFLDRLKSLSVLEHCQIGSFHSNSVGSDASAIYDVDDYNNTAINIVLETVVDERIHLTEKILRPIACGHPFMLAAGPGSLALLRKYGFETFNPYIDESYDLIHNPQERLNAIGNEMCRLSKIPKQQLIELLTNCFVIAQRNKKKFFSDDFFKQVTNELQDNVQTAFDTHKGEYDFTTWWNNYNWRNQYSPTPVEYMTNTLHNNYLISYIKQQLKV